jgi:hypothetical protein
MTANLAAAVTEQSDYIQATTELCKDISVKIN